MSQGSQYFADFKKGDIAELQQLMLQASSKRDEDLQLQLVKRVIAFMTLGIDVSRLFSQMIMVCLSSLSLYVIFESLAN